MLLALIEAKLLIQSPLSLRSKFKNGLIAASYANFGFIPYGHTMVSLTKTLLTHVVYRLGELHMTKMKTLFVSQLNIKTFITLMIITVI